MTARDLSIANILGGHGPPLQLPQQLLYRLVDLFDSDGFDTQGRVRDQATIARTRIALKGILDHSMFNGPGSPAA